jgi:hypothetical protein
LLRRELAPERERHRLLRVVEERDVAHLDLGVIGLAADGAELADGGDAREDVD